MTTSSWPASNVKPQHANYPLNPPNNDYRPRHQYNQFSNGNGNLLILQTETLEVMS
jgi:hypothetical protein